MRLLDYQDRVALSKTETARALGCTPRFVTTLINKGKLKARVESRHRTFISMKSIRKYLGDE